MQYLLYEYTRTYMHLHILKQGITTQRKKHEVTWESTEKQYRTQKQPVLKLGLNWIRGLKKRVDRLKKKRGVDYVEASQSRANPHPACSADPMTFLVNMNLNPDIFPASERTLKCPPCPPPAPATLKFCTNVRAHVLNGCARHFT